MKADRGEFVRSTQKAAEASAKFFAAFIESTQGFEKVFEAIIASAEDETDKNGAIDALAKVKKVTASLKTDSGIPVQYTVYLEVRETDLAEMKEVPFTKTVKIEGSNKISEERIKGHPAIYRVSRSATDDSPLRISIPGRTILRYTWREPSTRPLTEEDKEREINDGVEHLKGIFAQLNIAVSPKIVQVGEQDPAEGITDTATFKGGVITVRRGDKEEKIDLTEEKRLKKLEHPAKIDEEEIYEHFKRRMEDRTGAQEIMIQELGLSPDWSRHEAREFLWEPEILILVLDVVKSESIPEGVPVAPQVSTNDEPEEGTAPAPAPKPVQPDGATALELSFYTSVQQDPRDNVGTTREYIQNTVPFTLNWYAGKENLPDDYDFKKAGTTQENVTGSATIFMNEEIRKSGRLFIEAHETDVMFKIDHGGVTYPNKGDGEEFANSAYIGKIGEAKMLHVQVKHDGDVVDVVPEEPAPEGTGPTEAEVEAAEATADSPAAGELAKDLEGAAEEEESAETAGAESGIEPETSRFFQSAEEDRHIKRLLELIPKVTEELLKLSPFLNKDSIRKEFKGDVQEYIDKINTYLEGDSHQGTQKEVITAMREILRVLFEYAGYVLKHARAPLVEKRHLLAQQEEELRSHTALRDDMVLGSDERKAKNKQLPGMRAKTKRLEQQVEKLDKAIARLLQIEKELRAKLGEFTATFKTSYPGIGMDIKDGAEWDLIVSNGTRSGTWAKWFGKVRGEPAHEEGVARLPVRNMGTTPPAGAAAETPPAEPVTPEESADRLAAIRNKLHRTGTAVDSVIERRES